VILDLAGTQLTFTASPGGSNPPNQTLQISLVNTGGSELWTSLVSTSSGGNWLSVSPTTGSSSSLTVSANISGLPVGTYSGLISLFGTVQPSSEYTEISLTITALPVTLAPTSLTFGGTFGSTSPPSQTVTVTAA